MNSLVGTSPSAIRHLADAILFYFGTSSADICLLPAKAKFEIVHSPIGSNGWEFVRYQWFAGKSGLGILERRLLEPDEITYFERLVAKSKLDTGTTRAADV